MAKTAIILVLVVLTVMASAYNLRRPYFDQNVLTEEEDENTELNDLGNLSYTIHNDIVLA